MEKQFVGGVRVFRPREGAPDFIKLNIVFDKEALMMWLEAQEADERGQIRADLKESRGGNLYVEKNTWKSTSATTRPKTALEQHMDKND